MICVHPRLLASHRTWRLIASSSVLVARRARATWAGHGGGRLYEPGQRVRHGYPGDRRRH